MCNTKVLLLGQKYFCPTEVAFVQQKLLLLTKVLLSRQKYFCLDKSTSVSTKVIMTNELSLMTIHLSLMINELSLMTIHLSFMTNSAFLQERLSILYFGPEMSRPGSGTVHVSSNVAASHLLGNYLT